MERDLLEKRLAELQLALDQSAANHNALVGRADEVKHLLKKLDEEKDAEILGVE